MSDSINAVRRAELLLGYGIQSGEPDTRTYPIIEGKVYTDLFTGTPVVEGFTETLETRFNGKQTTPYKNEIIIPNRRRCPREVKVTATWGSATFLSEIDELIQWLASNSFADVADEAGVKSKKIEDFTVTYRDADDIKSSYYDAIRGVWSFYIRNVILINVTPEQKDDWRHF